MRNIIKLLPRLLEAAGENSELLETFAKIAWTRAAGDGLRFNAAPLRFYDGKLSVGVADAIWQTQLKAMTAELLARTNQLLGRDLIKSLEFRIDPKSLQTVRRRTERTSPRSDEEVSLPVDVLTAAGKIKDEMLRQRFLSAARSVIARRDSKALAQHSA
jgi:hypothetical protein